MAMSAGAKQSTRAPPPWPHTALNPNPKGGCWWGARLCCTHDCSWPRVQMLSGAPRSLARHRLPMRTALTWVDLRARCCRHGQWQHAHRGRLRPSSTTIFLSTQFTKAAPAGQDCCALTVARHAGAAHRGKMLPRRGMVACALWQSASTPPPPPCPLHRWTATGWQTHRALTAARHAGAALRRAAPVAQAHKGAVKAP